MPAMTQSEIEAFLQAPRHAVVGTNPVTGAPHLTPVWYLYENGRLYISIPVTTVKYRHLQRDPRLTVCVDGCHPDARTVTCSGSAELLSDSDPFALEMRWRIIRQYHETEAAAHRYAERVRDIVFALIVLAPEKVISQDFN